MDYRYHPSLALYLPLYELDGSSFTSRDAYGHLCAVTGATWELQGRLFDGTDDVIDCGNNSAGDILNFTSGDFSIMAWFKNPDISTYWGYMVTNGNYDNYGYVFGANADGSLEFFTYTSDHIETNTAIGIFQDDTWYCVGMSRRGSVAKLYINGKDSTATSGSHNDPTTSTRKVVIGGDGESPSRPFKGLIGEVWVFASWLDHLQHNELFNKTKWRYGV